MSVQIYYLSFIKLSIGEFDPGSERTREVGLTHASRTNLFGG